MAKLDELFRKMVAEGASDLHFTTGAAPCLRTDGAIKPIEGMGILTSEVAQGLIFEILQERHRKQFIENWELDTVYEVENCGRFRVNVFMQRKGIGAVFRHIPTEILSAEQLGLPPALMDMISVPKGLVLVTGPTGSGKSTTLAALVDWLNRNEKHHILTIEDPIEFTHENKMSLVNQREVGGHTKSFAKALKAALREDPDIILVGEMRDIETISLAITAAETGHLVFGTLHTMSAAKTVDRVIDVFPEDRQAQVRVMLSESLRGVVAQALLPKAGGKGRVAAMEILINSKAVANLIREGKTFQIPSTMQTSKNVGMQTFSDHIDRLIQEKKIDVATGYGFLGKPVPQAGSGGGQSIGSAGANPGTASGGGQQNPAAAAGNQRPPGGPRPQSGPAANPQQKQGGMLKNPFKKTS